MSGYNGLPNSQNRSRCGIATFAGGCFWCTQHDFDHVKGVLSTAAGYIGGTTKNPTYEEVCSGSTGHVEAIQITYDPSKVSYQQLLTIYWKSIDPTRSDGQFCDVGSQYRPLIFYHNEDQKKWAETSKKALIASGKHVVVDILPAPVFYPAEEYHQQYYKKNPARYQSYRDNSGRKA